MLRLVDSVFKLSFTEELERVSSHFIPFLFLTDRFCVLFHMFTDFSSSPGGGIGGTELSGVSAR